jgi:hypothetical protein
VVPCLIALSMDCDANINTLQRLGKLTVVLKYLDYSLKARDRYLKLSQPQLGQELKQAIESETTGCDPAVTSTTTTIATATATASAAELTVRSHTGEALRVDLQHVQTFSRMFPMDLWSIAAVTFSHNLHSRSGNSKSYLSSSP